MAFAGYLLKYSYTSIGGTYTDVIFPHNYIQLESWKSTPNQREEIRAYRDENTRNLTRVTASGKKSIFSFKTRPNLHLVEKQAIQTFFTQGEIRTGGDANERKIKLTFWNEETNDYQTGWFYRPNMEFPIIKITNSDIIYGALDFSFVEY